MKTLILDCDGVLYPESQFPIYYLTKAIEKYAYSINISKEEFKNISKQTLKRGEQGLFNFVLNLVHKNIDSFNEFCNNMIELCNYNEIKRDDELFALLLKASKKYEICIFTNNCRAHLDKVYEKLFGKSLKDFPFPSYDISFTLKDGMFHPKQSKDGYINFLKKIKKEKKECIVCDDSKANINRCKEFGIQYEFITLENNLKKVLTKLLK